VSKKRTLLLFAAALTGFLVTASLITVASVYLALTSFAPDRSSGTIRSSGESRSYRLHVPAAYRSSQPLALVISLHAAGLWPNTQAALTGWNALADRDTFIVVYPAGTALDGSARSHLPFRIWLLRPDSVLARNVQFIEDLVDTLSARYSIDPGRVYVTGFSNGGAMAFALSCRLSARLAAVGTVSAAQDQPWGWCRNPTPLPFINFHGTRDLVPYTGGKSWASPLPFPSAPAWTAGWAHRNGCEGNPIIDTIAPDAVRERYESCPNPVILYTIEGGGHAWPGGTPLLPWLLGRTTQSVNATYLMWSFFKAHPRLPS